MRPLFILVIIIFITVISAEAQSIILSGEQTIKKDKKYPVLSCTPVKITISMKITLVDGNCNGFWIQKGSETIHKFSNFEDPIGTILTPGVYYVYPNLKKSTSKANVSLTLKTDNT